MGMTDKQIALSTVRDSPDDASIEQINEELQMLAAVRRGQEDVNAGKVKPHEEVERLVSQWTSTSSGQTRLS